MTKIPSHANLLGLCLALVALAACKSGPPEPGSSSSAPDAAAILGRKVQLLEGLLAGRDTAARVMDELAAALPDRVRLTEAAYGSGEVLVKGIAPTNNLLADYIAGLGGSGVLADVMLRSSVQKSGRGGEYQEFALRALVPDVEGGRPGAPGSPEARLAELERLLPARQDAAEMLRELQMLALGSGLQMTKFVPGAEVPGEFYAERPVAIDVAGSRAGLGRYFEDLAGASRLWLVEKFSFKAVSPQDARSPVRASIAARTRIIP